MHRDSRLEDLVVGHVGVSIAHHVAGLDCEWRKEEGGEGGEEGG